MVSTVARETESPTLRARHICRRFGNILVLAGVTLDLAPGTLTILTGRNGSGKSTLVNCLTGFDLEYEGEIRYAGRDVTRKSADWRARFGIVRTFQYPHLFAELSVRDHLALGSRAGTRASRSYVDHTWRDDVPQDLVDAFDLRPILDRSGRALSFGEMKAVNTARAFATGASVLMLDEPLASLHRHRRDLVLEAIRRRRDEGGALLVIEHETNHLDSVANVKFELVDGNLVQRGLP